jgi:hypothetical protein
MKTTRTWYLSLLVALFLAPITTASTKDAESRLLAHIRRATAHFHHLKTAQAVGYDQFLDCVDEPGEGAMGIHFVHSELISDTVIDPLLPEALMYEPGPNGQLRLVGVEYIVFQEAWDKEHAKPPTLLGQQFHLHNPSGLFNDWNPRVHCPNIPEG